MVYKRYIKKNGKVYGPYIQHNKKVNGKVVTEYRGKHKSSVKKLSKPVLKKSFLFALFGLILVFSFLAVANFDLTGQVSLDIKSNYVEGEELDGNLKFSLSGGELIPADSKLILQLGDKIQEYFLSDFIALEIIEGNFYAEDTTLSGEGSGYGLVGSKKIYPDVNFDLEIVDAEETGDSGAGGIGETGETGEAEETGEEQESEEEIPEEEVEEEQEEEIVEEEEEAVVEEAETSDLTEQATEEDATSESSSGKEKSEKSKEKTKEKKGKSSEEVSSEGSSESSSDVSSESSDSGSESSSSDSGGDSGPSSSESSSSSDNGDSGSSDSGGSVLTGEVISGNVVSGVVSKDNDYEYIYSEGKEARLVDGSVNVDGEEIEESSLKINNKKKKVVVSTKYFYEEQGFGEEYLGKKKLKFNINLNKFDLIVGEDTEFSVKLIADDVVLVEASKDLSVEVEEEVSPRDDSGEPNDTEEETEEETNDTEEEIEEEINETEIIEDLLNETEIIVNETIEIVNETLNITDLMNINTTQYGAVLNLPVKWKKNVKLGKPGNVSIELPKEAENITVYKVVGEEREELEETNDTGGIIEPEINEGVVEEIVNESVEVVNETIEVNETEVKEIPEVNETTRSLITAKVISGEVTVEIDKGFSFIEFLRSIFGLTGRVIDVAEKEESKEVIIKDNATEYDVEYETPGPVAFETETARGKEIVISSDVHYENILAYSVLPYEVPEGVVKLYWITEENYTIEQNNSLSEFLNESEIVFVNATRQVRKAVEIVGHDWNNNSLVDYIEWVVPSLSNQTYELEIVVLNVQSYPTVGGNWTVEFTTVGTADLTVSAINETSFGFEGGSDDLVFLELECGDETQNVSVMINGEEIPYDVYMKKKRIEEIREVLG